MNDKQQFFALLKVAKRKILFNLLNKNIHLGLFILGAAVFLLMMLARFVVITHLLQKFIIVAVIVVIGFGIFTIIKRPKNREAARYFDTFVEENDVSTALHYLEDNSVMSQLQRRDAITKMKRALPTVQSEKLKLMHWSPFLIAVLLFGITISLFYLPNDTMKLAAEKEKEEEIVKETKEEIKELAKEENSEKLKEIEEETKELDEASKLLDELLKQEAMLDKEKQEAEEDEKKLKEIANEMKDLNEIAEALEEEDSEKLSEAIENLLDQPLASLSEEQQQALENLLDQQLNQNTPNLSELTDEQLGEMLAALEEQLQDLLDSVNSLEELLALQEQLQQIASSLQQNMMASDLTDSGRLAFGNPSQSGQGNQNEDPSNSGQEGNGDGQGDSGNGSGDGQGDGSGNGSGDGNGNGSGDGSGSGSGSGSGTGGTGNGASGSGAGFGQGSRELTIPEYIEGQENVEHDNGEFGEGEGETQTAPDGLVLKGSVRSYEEVYGRYTDSYRKSVERLELPAYLENVVKDYFSDLDPGGE